MNFIEFTYNPNFLDIFNVCILALQNDCSINVINEKNLQVIQKMVDNPNLTIHCRFC